MPMAAAAAASLGQVLVTLFGRPRMRSFPSRLVLALCPTVILKFEAMQHEAMQLRFALSGEGTFFHWLVTYTIDCEMNMQVVSSVP